MSPTVDDPLTDHGLPVFVLPDGTVLPSTDAHGRPIAGFNGLAIGTGPDGEIVIMPSDWSSSDTDVDWTPFSGVVHNGAAVVDVPVAAAGETQSAVAAPMSPESWGDSLTTVLVSVSVLAFAVAAVLGARIWRRMSRSL